MSLEISGELGDIFWDLPPWVLYTAGMDLGCTVYVANPTETEKEYVLMARLESGARLLSEESLPVYGLAWFKVEPGDLVALKGSLRFPDSNADLTVRLIERDTEEAADSVTTKLVTPSTSAMPPGWPSPGTNTGADWSSLLMAMMPLLMLAMVALALKPTSDRNGRADADGGKQLDGSRA